MEKIDKTDLQQSENLSTGWIRLYRSVLNSGWLHNHKLWVFWCYCLLKASHRPHKVLIGNQQVELTPGQFIFGRKTAFEETGLSEQNIRTCIGSLKKLKNLTIKSTNKYSIITVKNWTLYQGNNKILTSKVTYDQPAPNQHLTTYKNVNNGNNGNKDTTPEALRLSGLLASLILKNNPQHKDLSNGKKDITINRWAIDIDRMIRIDKRTIEEVEDIIKWCQADNFWSGNILSGATLRKQYDRLYLAVKKHHKKPKSLDALGRELKIIPSGGPSEHITAS